MADSSLRNAWVDKYLEALLGDGLSKEYVNRVDEGGEETDGYGTLAANYWINLIFDDEQENIVASWRKAKAALADADDSAARRRENQAWRIWSLMLSRESARKSGQSSGHGDSAADLHDDDESELGGDSGPLTSPRQSGGHVSWAPLPSGASSTPSPARPVATSKDGGTNTQTTRRPLSSSPFPGTSLPPGPGNLRVHTGRNDRDGSVTPKHGDRSPGTATSAQSERMRGDNPFLGRVDRLYIVLISMHGLVRGENMELGKDADTGGQVKYVVELARTLAHHPMVYRVDLLTRLITNKSVDKSYGEHQERLTEPNSEEPLSGAYIVRVKAGDPNVYIAKESLWPHVREFSDNALTYVSRMQQLLQKQSSVPVALYAVHGHYSDAGEAGALMAHTLGVPLVLTGHSLGRNKLDHLLRAGTTSRKQIEETYAITRRIEGEERALDGAMMVITSTQQEVDEQWGLYDGYRQDMADALKYRNMVGRAMPYMEVIPPGLDFSSLKVELPADPMELFEELAQSMAGVEELTTALSDRLQEAMPQHNLGTGPTDLGLDDINPAPDTPKTPGFGLSHSAMERRLGGLTQSASKSSFKRNISSASLAAMESLRGEPEIWQSVYKFLNNKAKPVILAMSRPDAKKNIVTLVRAFGENNTLREIANLVLVMGNRTKIDSLAKGSQQVLTTVLKLIDEYDLYGSVAYPKAHTQADISDIYLLAKSTKGVFVNIALQEPFGLTLIEAAVHGAPIVATRHGGPVDIIATLKNGKLVEPTDSKATAQAILDIILDKNKWQRYSNNGIKNILAYSWPSHCIRYLKLIDEYSREDDPGHGLSRMMTKHRKRNSDTQLGVGSAFATDADQQLVNSTEDVADGTLSSSYTKDPGAVSFGKGRFNSSVPDQQNLPMMEADTPGFIATDDISLSRRNDWGRAGRKDLRIASRSRVVYATMDTTFDMSLLASTLRMLLDFNASREAVAPPERFDDDVVDPNVGGIAVGILTMLSFSEVQKALQEADLEPTCLDFIVCSCGAYIMYTDVDGQWVADEAWEDTVCHRWDKKLVMRSLTRMQMNRPSEKSTKVAPNSSNVMRMVRTADGVDKNEGNGPHHVMLNFAPEDMAPLQAVDNATLIDKVRKRTRRVGIRCTLTLHIIPEETQNDDNVHSVLHATPLRASRSLALRHIVQSRNFSMADAVFLCTPVSMHECTEKDGYTVVGSLCSDMATLMEGAQKVVVVPPTKQMKLGASTELSDFPTDAKTQGARDQKAFNRLKVSLKPYDESRVKVLKAASELEGVLPGLLSAPLSPLVDLTCPTPEDNVQEGGIEQKAEE